MFADEIRRAVEAAPRVKLADLASVMWKAYAAGQITEDEASVLSDLIEARKVIPAVPKPAPRRVGARPRTSESLERRRRWAASGRIPPQLACRFSTAEQAVLTVVAVEVIKKGQCSLTIGHIAALAGVSETTVRNALRTAQALNLVSIERRRRTPWMNAPNLVRIVAHEWASWLRLHGCKTVKATTIQDSNERASRWRNPKEGALRRESGTSRGPISGPSASCGTKRGVIPQQGIERVDRYGS